MCTKPNTIKNPLYHRSATALLGGDFVQLSDRLRSKSEYISVPCGTCSECRTSYYNSILQRCIVESFTSYVYFVTLTYDNSHIPSVVLPNGNIIYYSDYTHIQDMIKRLRHQNVIDRSFRYLCVTEFGDSNHRPHFHLLFFIAKLPDDNPRVTSYKYEKILFDNLRKYYALNVGTRKHPIYESLFTYRYRFTSTGIKTNYFVKYVECNTDIYQYNNIDDLTLVKTIRYLIGYVNKSSSFNDEVLKNLNDIMDLSLRRKLKTLLTCKTRYSKGLGLGFDNGLYNYVVRSYVKCNYFTYRFTTSELPETFSDFIDLYPDMLSILNNFLISDKYSSYKSLTDFINDSDHNSELHIIILKYFPHYFSRIYYRYYKKHPSNDCISYFFEYSKPYIYTKKKIHTEATTYNNIFAFIRSGVQNGIKNKIPYLCFPLVSEGRFMALCDFYKERFTDPNDVIDMYDAIGAIDYDDYISKFESKVSTYQTAKQTANNYLKEAERIQKNIVSDNHICNLYEHLFIK